MADTAESCSGRLSRFLEESPQEMSEVVGVVARGLLWPRLALFDVGGLGVAGAADAVVSPAPPPQSGGAHPVTRPAECA